MHGHAIPGLRMRRRVKRWGAITPIITMSLSLISGFLRSKLSREDTDGESRYSAGTRSASSAPDSASYKLSRIHQPKDCKTFINDLTKNYILARINEIDDSFGGAPIHSIISRSTSDSQSSGASRTLSSHQSLAADYLVALLTYSNADINLRNMQGLTPLHIAVKMNKIDCAKVLLAFGADCNALDSGNNTPLDSATIRTRPVYDVQRQTSWTLVSTDQDEQAHSLSSDDGTLYSEMWQLLISVGGKNKYSSASHVLSGESDDCTFPGGVSMVLSDEEEREKDEDDVYGGVRWREDSDIGGSEEEVVKKKPVENRKELLSVISAHQRRYNYSVGMETRRLYREMEDYINEQTDCLSSLRSRNEMLAMQMQRKELARYKATGARVLCLDGGGMKGLIEVDVLEQLVLQTGKEIADLFDWFVATSTGAIIILGLLYAKKSLIEIRQLYYKLKDDVFASPRFGVAYNTSALNEILKNLFGTEMTMEHDSENMPKVIITAVNKKNKNPELQYFSNCFHDELCKTPVWKVARSASAAPLLFEEFEDCVDGGVLANNPCQVGLTRIENYHWKRHEKLPISLVVSVGSGINPPEKLGSVNAQHYLYFGTHWLKLLEGSPHEIKNLAELLSNALVDSETVANTTQCQCRERGIRFYRVSTTHDEIIVASETSNNKLCHMVVSARAKSKQQIKGIAKALTSDEEQKNS